MLAKITGLFRKIKFIPNNVVRNTPMLGRWCTLNKEYNDRKIDMANIDHCGTCYYDYKKYKSISTTKDAPMPLK